MLTVPAVHSRRAFSLSITAVAWERVLWFASISGVRQSAFQKPKIIDNRLVRFPKGFILGAKIRDKGRCPHFLTRVREVQNIAA